MRRDIILVGFLIYVAQIFGIVFHLEIISLLVVLLLSAVMCLICREKKEKSLVIFLIFQIAFQNLFIGLVAHTCGNTSSNLSFLTQAPTVLCYVLTMYVLLKKKIDIIDKLGITIIVLMLLSIIMNISNGTLIGKLNYFRNYSIFYCFFTIGRYYCTNNSSIKEILNFTEKYAVILSLIGIIFLFLPFEFFEMLGIKEVYIAKGSPLQGSFTGRFTTTLYKGEVNRIGSIMFEPINFGYFLILPFLSLYYKLKNKSVSNFMKFIIVTIGLVTTFAKGAYMICIFSIMIDFVKKLLVKFKLNSRKSKKEKNIQTKYIFLLTLLIGMITVFSLWYYKNVGAAANNHFYAIEQTFINTLRKPILGYGLGMGGNYGAQEDGWLSTGAESGMMGLIYQLGYSFFIIFASIFLIIGFRNIKNNKNFLIAFLPIIFLIVSIFQENTFTPQCLGITFIVAGSIYGINPINNNEESISMEKINF